MSAAPKAIGRWHRLVAARDLAHLEFETVIDGLQLNGVDMIHWDEADRIVRFKVMVRPFEALQSLIPLMAKQLGR